MLFKLGALKNVANFTGKHLCWSLFLIKLQTLKAWRPATLLKRDSNTSAFLWNLRIFFTEPLRWLLLANKSWKVAWVLQFLSWVFQKAALHMWCLGDLVQFVQYKTVKNTHGGMLLLVKKPAVSLKVTLLRGCFYVFKLCKWYQIAQNITYKI